MRADLARFALTGRQFADLRWVPETGSTNQDLLDLARSEPTATDVALVADHQGAGRGRLGRTWQAPPGSSLLLSVLVRPALAVEDLHLVTTALGLAAAQAVESVAGVELLLKWPNDLVAPSVDGSPEPKVAGVLAETVLAGEQVAAVVAGIGLNVNWPAELPTDLAGTATALNHLVGHQVDRGDLVVALLTRFEELLVVGTGPRGPELLREAYLHRSATVGRQVKAQLPSGDVVGRAVDVSHAGHLVVESDGHRHQVSAGDVIHLRPA